jgi:hypothetical protein
MKKAIITCIFGDYDQLQQAPNYKGWDCILFTDSFYENSKGWTLKLFHGTDKNEQIASRHFKFRSHLELPNYDLVCYIDANIKLLKEPPSVPFWPTHPKRKRLKDEIQACLNYKKITNDEAIRVTNYLNNKKYGNIDRLGLFQNGFFVRKHTPQMNKLMDEVFNLVQTVSHRDQICLPIACVNVGYKPENVIDINRLRSYYQILPHKKQLQVSEKAQVHHITPARSDKNFGKAINQLIEGLPDSDWICLRDIDTVPMYHEKFIQQCEEIANNPQGYDLIGCMTNRLGLPYQLVPNMFNEWDIKVHREKAKELAEKPKIKPLQRTQTIGGLMMLFSKQTWIKAGKFPEGGIILKGSFVDYHFSKAVGKFGKLGIAEHIYLLHLYRMDSNDTRTNKQHLI